MQAAALKKLRPRLPAHPNDLDVRRIENALKSRKRYRYVSPTVTKVGGGYRIESPCCSRNVDPAGGVIDVALLLHDADRGDWHLYRKDHTTASWEFHSAHPRLIDVLDCLNADTERTFWQ